MAISANHTKFQYPEYVSPLPAEIYIAGMDKKQQMYNEGRQRLQTQIDAYGQIKNQLVKEEDKAYFDSEMSNMLDAINKNVGADFAVKANVDAIMSIGKPLENNQYIKNAVTSSNNYRKMMEEFKSLKPEQRGAANDYFFMKNINSWMTDGQTGSNLSYNSYVPYGIDDKVYGEVMKTLKPSKETVIKMTPDGRFITKEVISGVSAERFQQALMGRLGEQGARQLAMDAQYQLETQGKQAVAQTYLFDQSQIAKGIENRLNGLQIQYQEALKKEGANSLGVMQIKSEIDDLSKKRNIIQSRLNSDPSSIKDSILIQHIISENIRDISGGYAYSSVEKDIEDNPYELERYKSNLDVSTYQQKEYIKMQFDAERDRLGITSGSGKEKLNPPPTGAEETTSALLANNPQIFDMSQTINSFQNEDQQNKFVAGFARHIANAKYTEDKEGRLKITGRGKNSIKDVIERIKNENDWNSTDYAEIVRSLGGGSKAELFFWKLKGLGSKLGIQMRPGDNLSSTYEDPTTTASEPTRFKQANENSTVIVNYAVPNTKPYSKKIRVKDFLNYPADELLFIQSINILNSSTSDYKDPNE